MGNVEDIIVDNTEIVDNLQDNKLLPHTMANEKETKMSRKGKIRDRLRWLTSRSKLTMRNFGSRDNVQNMKEGLQKSKERLSSALSPTRNRKGSYEWSVRLNSDGHNVRDSIIVMDGVEEQKKEKVVKIETKVEIKSFEVPVLKIQKNEGKRKSRFTKNKPKKGKNSIVNEESVTPVNDLEKLEKLVLRDSVRETLQKRKQLGPINEELDLAFNNLSYDALDISDASREDKRYYENIDANKSETQRMYENVQTEYENASVSTQFYENIPNVESRKLKSHSDEDYENYDFGESGIYQNILYEGRNNDVIISDLSSQVNTLRKSVSEVNKILEESTPIKKVESQPLKLFQSKLDIQLKLPSENGSMLPPESTNKSNQNCIKQETGNKSQENGNRNQENGNKKQETEDNSYNRKDSHINEEKIETNQKPVIL